MLFDVPWNVLALQLFFGLALGSIYVLLASGLSIIYGLLDVVNFAHGTFAMLGAYAVYLAVSLSGSFWIGIVSAMVIIGLIGGIVEWVFLKPLYGKDPLLPLLLTFGVSVAIPDLIKIMSGLIGKPVNYPQSLTGATMVGSLILPNYRLFIVLFTLVIMISLWIFLKKSDLGMIIRASTRDSLMVQVLGVNVSRIWTIGFAIGIGLAALAGAISAPMMAATPDMGVDMTMVAFVVTVVGGLGSLGGAIVGGLFIGLVVAIASFIAGEYATASMYFCMAVILLIRPRGLFGEIGRE
ncbi:MAG: branched-chain amino acid ABC transporter permease [Deltaproteobacteria bacterium]|nr:MAG: branched-chain amino acid ABC transporter permease [Deltaproteobacteria bacterium]